MARLCTICTHDKQQAIESAMVSGLSCGEIAAKCRVSPDAVQRHKDNHLPKKLVKADAAKEVARADDLLQQVRALQGKSVTLLKAAESEGDFRTALAGVREARACVELLAKLTGELESQPTVNITINPQWVELRTLIVQTLEPYPDARIAVAQVLAGVNQ